MLIDKINALKKEKNAVILVHNYQIPDIYKVADFIGDSLELAKKAVATEADIIVFCGVDFMAESAKLLNPDKKVLLPELEAQCPMAAMVDINELLEIKKEHPKAAVVSYINTKAETKAISYCCCTSANSISIAQNIEFDKIIMVPDQNLAKYTQRFTDKKIIPWKGYCYVHHFKFEAGTLKELKSKYTKAEVMVHPECPPAIIDLSDEVFSTSGMLKHAKESTKKEFIVGTEIGLIERLRIENPDKIFYSANGSSATCIQMKKTTLESVYNSLNKEKNEIFVNQKIAKPAKLALERMIKYS